MSGMQIGLRSLLTLALLAGAASLWRTDAADDAAAEAGKHGLTSPDSLGGAGRFLTHVSTDKPLYRPGEQLRVRGVVLHSDTHRPRLSVNPAAIVTITGPKGDAVASGFARSKDSVMAFSWDIPAELPGGQYTIQFQPIDGQPPAERTFDVRAYRAPRLKTQIKFVRDGYGPGDQVVAMLHVERAEGGIPEDAAVIVTARVDGEEVFKGQSAVDVEGNCLTRFALPAKIRRGEGTLAMAIKDGGVVETASKTIPILLQTVDLSIFPEGGDLVAGLKSRVYFEAFTPSGKPADLAGVIVDESGAEVGTFRSEHEGRGRFTLKPKQGEKYRMRITEPAGLTTDYELPSVLSTGALISSRRNVFVAGGPVQLRVASTLPAVTVTLSKKEKVVAKSRVTRQGRVRLEPAPEVDGVLVATVWDDDGKPLAERLVFRQPKRTLQVKLSTDAQRYSPGGTARLSVLTTDEKDRPVSAVVGVTVTDDSVLEIVEKRDQAPNLLTMAYLESEVKELADAHVYLDSSNASSPLALDLLLGTQGWRRFAFVKPVEFSKQHNDKARRVLASVLPVDNGVMLFGSAINEGGWKALPSRAIERPKGDVNDHFAADKSNKVARAEEAIAEEADAEKAEAKKVDANVALDRLARQPQAAKPQMQQLRKLADLAQEARFRRRGGRQALSSRLQANDFTVARVYAHQVRPNRRANDRVDFTETLYWHAGLKTDEDGRGAIEFGLNDAVTSFRVSAGAFSETGALGSNSVQIQSVKPFYLEPKLPLEVTQGDRILAPLGIVNATRKPLDEGSLRVIAKGLQTRSTPDNFSLGGEERRRVLLEMTATSAGDHSVIVDGQAGGNVDRITRTLSVKPRGFPVEYGRGGLLAANSRIEHEISIPSDVVPGTIRGRVMIYPTPLANMTASLERLIREPGGCFEQTSSTTYPLVMAQQYFMSHHGVDPSLIERSAGILEKGYNRLIGFESPSGGFEWFGRDPGHDALTAYGILEFTDMSQVRYVDPAMLERTRIWLLKQRDGKGGFVRRASTLHTWVPDPEISNSYVLWALLESGDESDLSTEIAWVRKAGETTQNTYVLALAANVLGLAGDREGQNHLLDKLAGTQMDNGSLQGATRSVVGSSGAALQIETTALAVMAWLKNPSYASNVEKSIKFLAESCKAGRFGSTQSTVLALRAIVAYDQSRATPKAGGVATLYVDGSQFGDPITFSADEQGSIELPEISDLAPGKHQISLEMNDGSRMPYSVAFDYYREQPDSSAECQLHLQVELAKKVVQEGTTTEANVTVVNRSDTPIPSPLAIVGVPGGLEVRHDQLKELVKAEKIAAYEVRGREVILYWRTLDAEQRVDVPLSLVAEIPGDYAAPASRAYLYYTDEFKQWTQPLKVTVQAK